MPTQIPTHWTAFLDVVNFMVGIAGIVVAIVALVIAILFYRFSQAHEASASQAMGKIEENTRILSEIISKVLTQMTRRLAERPPSESPDFLLQVLQVVRPLTQAVPQINSQEVVSIPVQVQILICVAFYSALANLGLQAAHIADFNNPTENEKLTLQMLTVSQRDCQLAVDMLGQAQYQAAIPQTTVTAWYHATLQSLPTLRSEAQHRAAQQPT
ncbi:MAG TPA: hypothetical protein VGJ48_25580 [Pyrinomonadaceae bacterium]|jgi:hypothetical protein